MFPNPPAIEEIISSNGTDDTSPGSNDHSYLLTGWFYYLGEIALKRLQNRVLQHRYGEVMPSKELDGGTWSSIADFDAQLDQWFVLHQKLESVLTSSQVSITPSTAEVLDDDGRTAQ